MKTIDVCVRRANSHSYDCCAEEDVSNSLLIGYGKTAKEAIDDFYLSYEELKAMDGDKVPDVEFNIKFDVGSLFNYYNFINMEGIAKLSGISPSVLRQYASGARSPKEKTLQMLKDGIAKATEQIKSVMLCA